MTTTYKYKSILINLLGVIITFLGSLTLTQWLQILPKSLAGYASGIMAIISFIAIQWSENKRVGIAENIKTEELTSSEDPSYTGADEDDTA